VANGSFASLKANVSIFKDENYALMVKTQDFANGFTKSLTYTDKHGYDFLSKSTLHGGELILSNIGSVGKVFRVPYFDRPMTLASNSVMVKCYNSRDYDWMYYFLLSPIGFEELKSITTGTAVPKFNKTDLKTIPLPVPPLAEQQRIVGRIESLFAKLDEAKEKAQAVVDSFETRKAAILHKAFTGELTAKWREEHGVRMESWEKFKFNELGTLERGRSKHRPRNDPKLFGGKYPFIQTGDVARSGMYITEHTQTLSELGAEQSKLFPKGTLCITIAANIGDVSILTYDCCFPDSVVGFTPNERTLSEYIYYLMSTLQREIEANAPATAQKNINLRILNDLLLDIPSVAEQTQIVNQVEYLFFQEQHAKEAAEAVLDQIDLMKKSILARAFRGELGTNDPSEESAVKLLRQVIEQEDGDVVRPKAKAKRIAIPAEIKPLLSGANEEAIVKLLLKAAPQSVSTQTVMSVSKKKFELMDALRNLEKKQIVSKSDSGEYSLVR
jgi:type I restriction enzyme S subunit